MALGRINPARLAAVFGPHYLQFRLAAAATLLYAMAAIIPLRHGSDHRPGRWSELCQSSEILGGSCEEELVARA